MTAALSDHCNNDFPSLRVQVSVDGEHKCYSIHRDFFHLDMTLRKDYF